jgi:NADH dehydrogenase [ubiquinone] 1 alpha subcomplex assembly factor 7
VKLAERIARLIAAQGPISVAQFMTMALHDPESGVYASREPIGARGDFTTAPEVSQIFGELLGLWAVQCWLDQGRPTRAHLVELGPGRGTLMADALRAAKIVPEFLDAIEVVLIESSPTLRKIQQEKLPSNVKWLDRFDESLTDRPLFPIANEFFDALPVRQYVHTPKGWCERMVTVADGKLAFALAPFPQAGLAIPQGRGEPKDGAVFETSPASTALAEEIGETIARVGGAALIVDYGYAGSGFGETLQAISQHLFAHVLDAPGEADLSAHVDFAALAEAATHAGAVAHGPIDQSALLKALGIDARAATLQRANPAETDSIASAVARLCDADKMGSLFKALAITPKHAPKPPGF